MFQLPHECRLYSKIEPANQWGFRDIALNKMVFYLETIVWQNGTPTRPAEKMRHKANQPKLFVPDFMKNVGINKDTEKHDTDDVDRILNLPRREIEAAAQNA